jgi:hypothetical protein
MDRRLLHHLALKTYFSRSVPSQFTFKGSFEILRTYFDEGRSLVEILPFAFTI